MARKKEGQEDADTKDVESTVRELMGGTAAAGLTSSFLSVSPHSVLGDPEGSLLLGSETSRKIQELTQDNSRLRREVEEKARKIQQLRREKASAEETAIAIGEFEAEKERFYQGARLQFLLVRVNERAKEELVNSEGLRNSFLSEGQRQAFVMSVDIRRSTELMLKAREPQQFARFMMTLCGELETVVKDNYGVFDKFTGDGILAFFPEFFSGEDAGFYAVSVADKCHRIFGEKYREFRSSFTSVLKEVGLGIGIDYGPTHLVQVAGGLTVVGSPVVYACRLGGAPPDTTLLNQPAYEKISEKFSANCSFQETELDIKHEGSILAYKVRLFGREYLPCVPSWDKLGGDRSFLSNSTQ